MEQNPSLLAFNRGVVSPLALGRIDVKRLAMSAEIQTNFIPLTLGPMSLRPGTQMITATNGGAKARYLPFVFSLSDTALVELTDMAMRVVVNDQVVSRVAVSTFVTNGSFATSLAGWTNSSDAGGSAAQVAGPYAMLTGDGVNGGAISQQLATTTSAGLPHGLRFTLARGECYLRIGSAVGLDDYIGETLIGTGTHSLQVTPTGDIFIELKNREPYPMLVKSVEVEGAGPMMLPSIWPVAALGTLRHDQSADVLFCANSGYRQQRIERRGVHSWSLVDFVCDDGPFLVQNVKSTTLSSSALTGTTVLTASVPLFKATHQGALFRVTSVGQNTIATLSSADTYTSPVEVTGLTALRGLNITLASLTGSTCTVTLQRSVGAIGAWTDVASYTTDQTIAYNDALDNQIIYYRLGIKPGGYAAGKTVICRMDYAQGATTGIARVTGFLSPTQVQAVVLKPFGGAVSAPSSTTAVMGAGSITSAVSVVGTGAERTLSVAITGLTGTGDTLTLTKSTSLAGPWTVVAPYTVDTTTTVVDAGSGTVFYRLEMTTFVLGGEAITLSAPGTTTTTSKMWNEGAWSGAQGWPSAVVLHESRLWWAGKDKQWGSISDTYSSNDDTFVGDAGPISRSIGAGPLDSVNWLLSDSQLIIGAQLAELAARSDSLGSPITPTNFNIKQGTSQGSAPLQAVRIDNNIIFVNRSGSRVFSLAADVYTSRYSANDLTVLSPSVCQPSVVALTSQRNLDTRLHFVLSDGTVALLVFNEAEDVKCWVKYTTNGVVVNAVVLPSPSGSVEDAVYYTIARTVGSVTTHYLEKWALQSECVGSALNKQADCAVVYANVAATNVLTGLNHLNGSNVVCWADGIDQGAFAVAGGSITLPSAVTNAVVGLGYQAQFKSAKLADQGAALTQKKRVDHIGLVLANTHYQGLQYGQNFDVMDDMPLKEQELLTPANTVWAAYEDTSFELDGTYDSDARLCLQANAPRPCTVVAVRMDLSIHEKG
jgi:hypothetical protein